VRLGGFYRTYAHHRHPDDPHRYMRAVLDRLYGTRLPERIPDAFSREMQLRHGIGLTREWVRQARGVIVNSAFAERLLRLDQGPDARIPRTWRVPFAIPAPRAAADVERFTHPPVIASFGMVDAVKGPEILIGALAEIRRHTPARLVFVGPIWDLYLRELESLIATHALEGVVEFTGDVSDAEYAAWLHRATVAAQLRRITNGESSAAVGDCLAAGLPVVTNMINAAEEFPAGAVSVIDFDCGAHEVAVAVTALLDDEARRHQQAASARRHAEQVTHAHLADRLMEIVEEMLDGAAPPDEQAVPAAVAAAP
jgi:glycosyltransferase involved in cell wall biosynthesis